MLQLVSLPAQHGTRLRPQQLAGAHSDEVYLLESDLQQELVQSVAAPDHCCHLYCSMLAALQSEHHSSPARVQHGGSTCRVHGHECHCHAGVQIVRTNSCIEMAGTLLDCVDKATAVGVGYTQLTLWKKAMDKRRRLAAAGLVGLVTRCSVLFQMPVRDEGVHKFNLCFCFLLFSFSKMTSYAIAYAHACNSIGHKNACSHLVSI